MALVSVRIGSMANIHVFEDADYDSAIETTAPIKAGPPVDGNDVVRLDDLPFLVAFVSHIVNHVLTLADLRKVHLFNSALNLICTLPSVDATFDYECSSCAHSERMDVPLTVQFFWPQSK